MIDPDDLLIHRAKANRWLLRATWAAILILLALNVRFLVGLL